MNRIDRLTAIVTHLQSKKTVKAQEIADRFAISLRTVYRDIRSLEEAGIPLIGEAGVGYSLVDGFRIPPVQFTKDEVLSFIVAEKVITKSLDPTVARHFHGAMLKIKAVLRSGDKDMFESLSAQVAVEPEKCHASPKPSGDTMQILLYALAQNNIVRIRYTRIDDEKGLDRVVEPMGIYNAYEKWYLIGWCRLRMAYRTFRLDRIETIKMEDEQFIKAHPSLVDYLNESAKKENLQRVVIAVPKRMAKYLLEQKFTYGFVMEKDTELHTEMTFLTGNLEWFLRWILMFGDSVCILEPAELKVAYRDIVQRMAAKITSA